MKRVAIITNIPAPYRVDFFDYLQKNYGEYEFTIIYSSRNEDNRSWDVDQEKMKNSVFLESKTLKIKKRYDNYYLHIPVGVCKVLNKLKPDVVVGSEYNPTVLQALYYCKSKKVPFISWTDGTLFSERNRNFVQKFLRKFVVSKADAFIASSTKSKEAQVYYGADEKKCHTSFLAVDVEKYIQKPQGKGEGKILCVGSLIERKGVDLLFQALAKVESDYSLYLAGDGEEKAALKTLAEELKISDKVHFLGQLNRAELLKYYADSDLFVFPTREDCFALVILEAMCAGLPIVCSKYADGAYDLIEENVNGLIVDPYDAEKFASSIDAVLSDKELQNKMQTESGKVLDKFRFENIAKGYMAAIEECVKE